MERIYFGHPINFYNTPKESELIKIIETEFPQFAVENPNQQHHQQEYLKHKAQTGSGMGYFFNEVLPNMSAGTFLSFEDGKFGAGVLGEAAFLNQLRRPIYEITIAGKISQMSIDFSRMLSIEETRKRVYSK